ncbi:MAG: GAF domain-containing protein, partial [Betaproteobacteria bacterium]
MAMREYGIGVAGALLAIGLHTAVDPVLHGRVPFMFFLPAALLIAVAVGSGPALLVVATGAIRAFLILPPAGELALAEPADQLTIALFLAVGAVFVWVGARMSGSARRSTATLRDTRDELRLQVDDLERLHELSTRMVSGEALSTQLLAVLEALAGFHNARQGLLWLYDPSAGTIEVAASLGFSDEALASLRSLPSGPGACGMAWTEGQRIVIEDTTTDPRFVPCREFAAAQGFRAVHSTPLVSRDGKVIGAVSIQFPAPHAPDAREQRLADMCARKAALLVERERALNALLETRRHEEQALKEADRRKDEFLATLAHELRNPLAPIRQAAAISSSRIATAEQKRASHVIIDRQVRHMARL